LSLLKLLFAADAVAGNRRKRGELGFSPVPTRDLLVGRTRAGNRETNYQTRWHNDPSCRRGKFRDGLERQRHGIAAEFSDRLSDAGQRRRQYLGQRVVVTDDRHIVGNANSALMKRLQGVGSKQVGPDNDRSRLVAEGETSCIIVRPG
jgi:hypothetical protein